MNDFEKWQEEQNKIREEEAKELSKAAEIRPEDIPFEALAQSEGAEQPQEIKLDTWSSHFDTEARPAEPKYDPTSSHFHPESGSSERKLESWSSSYPTEAKPPVTHDPASSMGFEQDGSSMDSAATKPNENFYRETIKHEPHHKEKKGKFGRAVAIGCIASILGGSSVGLGFAAFNTFVDKFLPDRFDNKISRRADFAFSSASSSIDISVKDAYLKGDATLADIVERVEPSVVAITSVVESKQIFNIPIDGGSGSGSGIIFHEDEDKVYIATNAHVVEGASSVRISVENKDPIAAKLVGSDTTTDLAVIYVLKTDLHKVGVENLVFATFGESDDLRVGEFVLAIGNALGEGNTATMGIVSAKDKQIKVEGKTLDVLQTDAAINPGNSGGPLVNLKGEVIGINTAKLSQSTVEGMGYSITSKVAKPIIESLMNTGSKPFLGISGYDVPADMAKFYNLPELGVYVNSVVAGSSAEKAGIKKSDIIVGFNDKSILSFDQLTEAIKECGVGQTAEIKLIRDGKTQLKVNVKLSEYTGGF